MQIDSPATMEQYVPLGHAGGHGTVQNLPLPTCVHSPFEQSSLDWHGLPISPEGTPPVPPEPVVLDDVLGEPPDPVGSMFVPWAHAAKLKAAIPPIITAYPIHWRPLIISVDASRKASTRGRTLSSRPRRATKPKIKGLRAARQTR